MKRKHILELTNVTKTYGKGQNAFTALHSLSLKVGSGEMLAIVGKSGSGKSTLMHIMALLDVPNSGEILVDGKKTNSLKTKDLNALRNKSFGFVFQQFFLNANETVLDNVILPLKIAGVSNKERIRRGMEILGKVDLKEKALNRANDLSGGQKQRVVIARALINNPKIIFADEPTGNLDSITGEAIENLLFELNRKQGITVIVVTHHADLARRCDRELHIKDGHIVKEVKR